MQQTEYKDSRLKYVEAPKVFYQKANEVNLSSKQHLRACEKIARHLANKKSKTAKEFEQDEFLKDFVIKSAALNEKTINLIQWMAEFLAETAIDSTILIQGSNTTDKLKDQSETILSLFRVRDNLVKDIYEMRKDDIRRNQAAN